MIDPSLVALALGLALAGAEPEPACDYPRAKALLRAGDNARARALFEACLAARPEREQRWVYELGVALSHDQADEREAAARLYDRFVVEATGALGAAPDPAWRDKWAPRVAEARRALERLEADLLTTHARVRWDEGARIAAIGDRTIGERERAAWITPGRHVVVWERDGATGRAPVELAAGERVTLVLATPADVVGPEGPPLEVVVSREPPARPPPEPDPGPWILGGTGVALLGSALVLTLLDLDDVEELESLSSGPSTAETRARYERLRARVEVRQPLSWALYGLGGAAVVGAIVWAALADDDEARVALSPLPGGAGLTLGGRF